MDKMTKKRPIKRKATKLNNRKIAAIKRSFENWCNSSDIKANYENWYCGITKFSDETRKIQHEKKKDIKAMYFKILDAGTKDNAHQIEVIFHEMGMKNAKQIGGAKKTSKYVYIYKEDLSILDKILDFIESLNF